MFVHWRKIWSIVPPPLSSSTPWLWSLFCLLDHNLNYLMTDSSQLGFVLLLSNRYIWKKYIKCYKIWNMKNDQLNLINFEILHCNTAFLKILTFFFKIWLSSREQRTVFINLKILNSEFEPSPFCYLNVMTKLFIFTVLSIKSAAVTSAVTSGQFSLLIN